MAISAVRITDPALPAEGYRLTIEPESVTIAAADDTGFSMRSYPYLLTSLRRSLRFRSPQSSAASHKDISLQMYRLLSG